LVQDALVLENLINQLVATMSRRGDDTSSKDPQEPKK
jgi:hypothetical protein